MGSLKIRSVKFFIINFHFIGDVVFAQGAAATPNVLLEAMTHHAKECNLKDITVIHMHTEGEETRNFFLGQSIKFGIL